MIRLDRRACAFLAGLVAVFALATGFKVHGSSIGIWRPILLEPGPDSSLLAGQPRLIRSDEWSITTLAMLGQVNSRPAFPIENPSWGPERVPLIASLPARHWSMLLRPQFLGLFALDVERGFAFYWNAKALLLLSGVFLLLLLLTENDFGVSVLGTAWVFFSGFVQWWYSTPAMLPELIGCAAWGIVAAHHLALSPKRWVMAASAPLIVLCAVNAALAIYPPFQVPIAQLSLAVLAGSLAPRLLAKPQSGDLPFRAGCAGLAIAAIALLLALYVGDVRATVDLMLGTVYPGARRSLGGDVSLTQVFGGFFAALMSEQSFPKAWQNVCEASGFLLLFPIPLSALALRVTRREPVSAIEWSLCAYLLVTLAWMAIGGPRALAIATGFGFSQGTRPVLGLGLGSILLCCVFLARSRSDLPRSLGGRIALASAGLGLLALLGRDFARVSEGVFPLAWIALACLVAAASGLLLLARRRISFAAFVLVPAIWSHALVNPVVVGLGPILDSAAFRQVSEIVAREPDARWAAYSGYALANWLKAAGAQVANGTKIVPPLAELRALDPDRRAESVYNRYANVSLIERPGAQVSFELRHADAYTIAIDPKSELWGTLGVRYLLLRSEPVDRDFLARNDLVIARPEQRLWVYRRR
ncbi:MAG: hypothetical protein FJ108_12730 [Deltaproteobacteria bacterium]|nr:hypothetical protein [Deltaproteobacteria bacterium]